MTNREAGTPRAARGETSGVGAARTLLMEASARAAETEVIMRAKENISRTLIRMATTTKKVWCEESQKPTSGLERNVKTKESKGAGAEVHGL